MEYLRLVFKVLNSLCIAGRCNACRAWPASAQARVQPNDFERAFRFQAFVLGRITSAIKGCGAMWS